MADSGAAPPGVDSAAKAPSVPDVDLLRRERARIQRRTLTVLISCQVIGGLGMGIALAVGTLVARQLSGSDAAAGSSVTMVTLGAAALAMPLASRAAARGRRPALSLGWFLAALGAVMTVLALAVDLFALMLGGFALLGAATATNLQSRYAATDLAEPAVRARSLSLVVWATTVGAVLGPNLSQPATGLAKAVGLPELSGPFLISTAGFMISGTLLLGWLRPDPLRTAQALGGPLRGPDNPQARGRRGRARGSSWRSIRVAQEARVGLTVVVVGQAVMVGVMAMTPVHLIHHGATLRVVGFTISLHVAGMYALSPVFGWLADRWGRRRVLLLGLVMLAAAVLLSGTAGAAEARLVCGLVLLGLGWSAGMVAGSTAVAEAVPIDRRPDVQGLADGLMGLSGAVAAALSGVAVAAVGFGGLNALAGLLLVPAVVAVLGWSGEPAG